MLKVVFLAVLASVATGCSSTRVVVLQQPKTKKTVECRINSMDSSKRTVQIEDCISSYEQAGYTITKDSETP